jgi:FkbM family methyltransferase
MPNFLQLLPITGLTPLWHKLVQSRIPAAHLEQRNGIVYVRDTDVQIDNIVEWASSEATYWISRLGKSGAKLREQKTHSFTMAIGETVVMVDGPDAAFIAWEVLCGSVYKTTLPWNKAIVIDVGMNLGFASLAFLRESWCQHVYGFEPSEKTFLRARKNLSLNPKYSARCTMMNFGLGAETSRLVLHAAKGQSGNATMVPQVVRSQVSDNVREEVEIRRADKVLEDLYARIGPDTPIVLKMDCEGAESLIFAVLSDELIRRPDVVLLEWHSANILKEVLNRLASNGFVSFIEDPTAEVGILRAVKVEYATASRA